VNQANPYLNRGSIKFENIPSSLKKKNVKLFLTGFGIDMSA